MVARRSPKGRRNGAGADASGSLSRSAGFDDIPKDDEDLFETSRDQILLDGYERAAVHSDDDMDVGLNNREVLGIDEARSDEEDDSELEGEQDEEAYDDDQGYSARQARKAKKPDIVVSSDDDDDLDNGEDDEEDDEDEGREVHENDRGWGTNKRAYYNTNDLDAMDSDSEIDEDQARELELKEVKRLQKKSRSVMDDADFGLGGDDGDSQLARSAKDASREQRRRDLDGDGQGALAPQITSNGVASTNGVAAGPADESSRRALLAKLQQTSPEAVALAGEYADMLEEFGRVDHLLNKMMAEQPNHASLEVMHVHYQTLATYITTMTFYFHLRASPEFAAEPAKLRTHPAMQRMMRLKQGLSVMEDLGLTFEPNRMPSTNGELSSDDMDEMQMLSQGSGGSEDDDLGDLDEDELADLMADADDSSGKENAAPVKAKKGAKQKRRNKDDDDDEDVDYTEAAKPKQQKKATKKEAGKKKVKKPEPVAPLAAGLADLDAEPALQVKLKKKGSAGNSAAKNPFAVSADATNFDDATFGELSELSSIESAERAARKRSLQFHASAIESKALQRAKAAKERQSGDADIPYRDRERSRAGVEATKAAREAKLQQQLNGGMGKDIALDGQDGWGDADEKDWRDVMGQPMESSSGLHRSGGDDDDDDNDDDAADYYDLVTSSRKRARAEAKAEYDDARNAERFALMEDQELEDGEHRGITRQIEKNKGLTPHRPKTSRNPRVKKRLKYEKAKKKLGSRQAVYKGGQSNLQGGYGGEASGISTHLVKSRKLG